ncbi:MAG: HIT family protein [Defluviitaleaceae bacterium]|nr:HIT family protein [Defluviitaleaceae bacterium]
MSNSSFSENIFYKIIQGEAPSHKIYEDDDFFVILDLYPANLGHCLVLPKVPAVDIFDLNEKSAAALYPLAKKVAAAVKDATGCDGVNIIQNNGRAAGQVIFYFHLHVVPRYNEDGIRFSTTQKSYDGAMFEEMAEKLRKEL